MNLGRSYPIKTVFFLGQWAKKTGLEHNQNVLNGTGMSMSSELKYKIADKVVFQKVKTALGKNKSFIGLILKLLDCNKKLAGIKVRNTILVLKYTFLVQNRLKLGFMIRCECKWKSSSINQLYKKLGPKYVNK